MEINKELSGKIEKYFLDNKNAIIQDIFRLVRVKSVTQFRGLPHPFGEDCANVLDEAVKMAEEKGFKTENFNYYAATATLGNQNKSIGFGVHLDVVPEGEGWKICPPYEPVEHEGYLIGRGVADNKGGTVLSMYVAKCIEELNIPLNHSIKVIMGCNEEKGSNCMDYYIANEKNMPVFSIVPDSVFPVTNGEKGMIFLNIKIPELDGNIILAGGGTVSNSVADSAYVVLVDKKAEDIPNLGEKFDIEDTEQGVKITAYGVAAHTANPENGINAIGVLFTELKKHNLVCGTQQKLSDIIIKICKDYNGDAFGVPLCDEPSGKLTHVLGVLKMVEGRFILECNMRYPVTIDNEAMTETIKNSVKDMNCEIAFFKNVKPSYIPADAPVVKMLMKAYNGICNDDAQPFISGGGTYARILPNAVAFGTAFPNSPSPFGTERGGMHQSDECLKIEEIILSGRILTEAVIMADNFIG